MVRLQNIGGTCRVVGQCTASLRNVDVLVLSRSVGETIRIGPDVYVTVVRISPYSVRIGIEAPQETSVIRGELLPDRTAEGEAHPLPSQSLPPQPLPTELPDL